MKSLYAPSYLNKKLKAERLNGLHLFSSNSHQLKILFPTHPVLSCQDGSSLHITIQAIT